MSYCRQIFTNGILKTEHLEIHLSDKYAKIKLVIVLVVVVVVVVVEILYHLIYAIVSLCLSESWVYILYIYIYYVRGLNKSFLFITYMYTNYILYRLFFLTL